MVVLGRSSNACIKLRRYSQDSIMCVSFAFFSVNSKGERTDVFKEKIAKTRDIEAVSLSLGELCYLAIVGGCTDDCSNVYRYKDYL